MDHPLDGIRAKLRRAEEHIEAYVSLYNEFIEGASYSIQMDFDPDSGWHEFSWRVHQDAPAERLALIYGDALTNLRGCLDHLVWQLVLQANMNPPTDRTAFPIVKRERDWPGASGDRLRGVGAEWVDTIRELQPYHRAERPELHPLALLDNANNINKHRTLPVVISSSRSWRVGLERLAQTEHHFDSRMGGPVIDGDVFFRIKAKTKAPITFNFDDSSALFRIGFEDGLGYEWDIADVLDWVRDAIARFEPAFAS